MATSKKSAAPKTKTATAAAFPAKSAPAKPTRVKKGTAAKPPAVVAKPALPNSRVRPAPKRTMVDAGPPVHKARTAAQLIEILSTFPKGALVGPMINVDDDLLAVYNMRGRCIAQIQKDMKPGTAYTK